MLSGRMEFTVYSFFCRVSQAFYRMIAHFLPWSEPKLIKGKGSISMLPGKIKNAGFRNVLLITDSGVKSAGHVDTFLKLMDDEFLKCSVYSETSQNPSINNVNDALEVYDKNECEAIVALGGGSVLDCAKVVAAKIAKPNSDIKDLKAIFLAKKSLPTVFAVPTTAGSGSEASSMAVIFDTEQHKPYLINDVSLVPPHALLDATLTTTTPQYLTATLGISALGLALEVFVCKANTPRTKKLSKKAIKLIFENLLTAYTTPTNYVARENMQLAAYYAGIAYTRTNLGYISTISHVLGAFCKMPTAFAASVALPHVIEYYGADVFTPLAELADLIGVGSIDDTVRKRAEKFVAELKLMNEQLDIPQQIQNVREKDISSMVATTISYTGPFCPVPEVLTKYELEELLEKICVFSQ